MWNTAPQSSTVSLLPNGRVSKDHRSKLRGLHDQTNSKQSAKKKVKKKSGIAEYAQYQTGGQASRQQVSPLSSGFLLQSQQNQTNNFDSSSGVIGQAVKFPICSNIVLGNPAFGLASHNAQSGVPLQGQVNDSLGNWDPTTLVLSPDQDYSLQDFSSNNDIIGYQHRTNTSQTPNNDILQGQQQYLNVVNPDRENNPQSRNFSTPGTNHTI
ncbi:5920_t:CDS:2 [Gigaspora margarita]|uniref:5920_t:CDS:1 n=1 Tax=Gigaspora margarita TaxID=4874 RepID=A0ABN7UJQ5_GIGMA|nr:5920_t:CDS:2 [Gigaspora margarita]